MAKSSFGRADPAGCALNLSFLRHFVENPFLVSKVAKARWLTALEKVNIGGLGACIQTENRSHLEDSPAGSWDSQSGVPRPAAAARPEDVPGAQMGRPGPWPSAQKPGGVAPASGCFQQSPRSCRALRTHENQAALHSSLTVEKSILLTEKLTSKYAF